MLTRQLLCHLSYTGILPQPFLCAEANRKVQGWAEAWFPGWQAWYVPTVLITESKPVAFPFRHTPVCLSTGRGTRTLDLRLRRPLLNPTELFQHETMELKVRLELTA